MKKSRIVGPEDLGKYGIIGERLTFSMNNANWSWRQPFLSEKGAIIRTRLILSVAISAVKEFGLQRGYLENESRIMMGLTWTQSVW